MRFQNVQRPDLAPLALLVRKFGAKIEGGGYEVVISPADSVRMLATGTFQEHKDPTTGNIHWRYFPNPTIEITLAPENRSDYLEPVLTEEESKAHLEFLQKPETDDGGTT